MLTLHHHMIKELDKLECVACKNGELPLVGAKSVELENQVGNGWRVVKDHHLEREFAFKDFQSALEFTNRVGELAEKVGHHPDIHLAWGKVKLTVWTHKINGLTESDFIFAAKVNRLS